MTNIEMRLQRELPLVADAILAQPVGAERARHPGGWGRRALAMVAALVVLAALGGIALQQLSPASVVIETTTDSPRVQGLDSELFWLPTDSMAPALPRDSHVRFFALADDVVLERGDLVIVDPLPNSNVQRIRRIVGLPGEVILGPSSEDVTSGRENFGYTVRADNAAESERVTREEIQLWAPADTSAIPPLLPSERAAQEVGLRACLNDAGFDADGIDFSSPGGFDELFEDLAQLADQGDIEEPAARAVVDCTRAYGDLSR